MDFEKFEYDVLVIGAGGAGLRAATPPSAMTVCAFPRSDLQIRPTFTPAADASMAARNPA